jgi:hypothetical protein
MLRSTLLLLASVAFGVVDAQYAPPDPSGFQGLIVETYYVADAADAADTEGGPGLVTGAKVYRIYADLLPGYKLNTVGGFPGSPMTLNTTTTFFNNEDRGDIWGRSIPAQFLDDNTVAIDSWLTLGAASNLHWGVLKTEDSDGSIVGGANNNSGLLVNNAAEAGIPLTTADGLINLGTAPGQIVSVGVGPDCFDAGGSNSYSSDNFAYTILGGSVGPTAENRILIGQFTTDGELSFCLNLSVIIPPELVCDDPNCHTFMEFLSTLNPADTVGGGFAVQNKFLNPTLCFVSSAAEPDCLGIPGGTAGPGTPCDDGNADTNNDSYSLACVCLGEDCAGVQGGTALPGEPCDDGNADTSNDVWLSGCTCQGSPTALADLELDRKLNVHPNPTNSSIMVSVQEVQGVQVTLVLRDALGRSVISHEAGVTTGVWRHALDLSALGQGVYLLDVTVGDMHSTRRIIKQ